MAIIHHYSHSSLSDKRSFKLCALHNFLPQLFAKTRRTSTNWYNAFGLPSFITRIHFFLLNKRQSTSNLSVIFLSQLFELNVTNTSFALSSFIPVTFSPIKTSDYSRLCLSTLLWQLLPKENGQHVQINVIRQLCHPTCVGFIFMSVFTLVCVQTTFLSRLLKKIQPVFSLSNKVQTSLIHMLFHPTHAFVSPSHVCLSSSVVWLLFFHDC